VEHVSPPCALRDRPLLLDADAETRAKRWGFLLLALLFIFSPAIKVRDRQIFPGGYLSWILAYNASAHPGVDQNGYQVGGKLFADTFSTGTQPPSPFSYVGWMWVVTKDGWFYPKYPLGLPVINAALIWIGGREHGVNWAYLVSPYAIAFSLLAMFFMARMAAGSFAGFVAMILLGMSPATLILANNSNSHAPCLAFVTWGMLLVLWWWQHGSWWRGLLGGFLLGYAVTIRYTEGLLLVPLLFVCLTRVRWRSLQSWIRCGIPVIGWAVPCVLLVAYNLGAMGTITGYDTTNESTGFSVDNFKKTWEFAVAQLHDIGLYFVLPLALLGMLLVVRWNWKLGVFMLLWFFPGTLLYFSYYWGLNTPGVAYLRFFLTLFPPAIFAVAWLMHHAERRVDEISLTAKRRVAMTVLTMIVVVGGAYGAHLLWKDELNLPACIAIACVAALIPAGILGAGAGITRPIAAGLVVAIASGVATYQNIGGLERDFTININLAYLGDQVYSQLPTRGATGSPAMLLADGRQMLNYLQFKGDYECYSPDAFTPRGGRQRIRKEDQDAPNPLQPDRIEKARALYEGKSEADLAREFEKTVLASLRSGRKAYALVTRTEREWFRKTFITDKVTFIKVSYWRDPVQMSPAAKVALNNMGAARWWLGYGEKRDWELWEIRLKGG
jgi:4-amino-4-deoxy-L-arabinose transferase-like glycosyltransferase